MVVWSHQKVNVPEKKKNKKKPVNKINKGVKKINKGKVVAVPKKISPSINHNRLVTVIIPSYNCAKYIIGTIQSVVNQTYTNWEIIVIDDCSKDKTSELVKKYITEKGLELKIKLITNRINRGCYVNFNLGLQQARGEYVCILGSDDKYHSDKLAIQTKILDNHPRYICSMGYYQRERKLVTEMTLCTVMFRRAPIIKKIGYFDSVRYAADCEFLRRIKAVFGKKRCHIVKKVLYYAIKRPNSLTQSPATRLRNNNRITYWQNAKEWQKKLEASGKKHKLYIPFPLVKRPFKAPRVMLGK